MRELLSTSRRVAESDTTLLILGETGVGKEWLARGIHAEGPRSAAAFLAVNCGAIPEGLLESELFGHVKGSFTGATSDRRGHFELAHGGTLFLDEIGEMSSQVQVKLLRVLQEKTIQPVGGERQIAVDVRVMAATNRDPNEEMEAGRMRRDLYYRLGVVTLSVPPLRERREDIADLVENYFEIYRVRLGRAVYGIHRSAMAALVAHDWPGNVRELINVMERAVLLSTQEEITVADLPAPIADGMSSPVSGAPGVATAGAVALDEAWLKKPLREARREAATAFERQYLTALLTETGGRIADTASRAGVSPRALFERMKQLGLRKEDFRPSRSPKATRSPE
jgi:DNA-binding NtrC family response regulator